MRLKLNWSVKIPFIVSVVIFFFLLSTDSASVKSPVQHLRFMAPQQRKTGQSLVILSDIQRFLTFENTCTISYVLAVQQILRHWCNIP